MRNQQILLASRPEGMPQESNFKIVESAVEDPQPGQFLVQTHYLSVDPYMRGRMRDVKSYADPVSIGEVMVGGTVGKVIKSQHARYRPDDLVVGSWGWQSYAVSDGKECYRLPPSEAPLSTALGVRGMPGLTAYFGLLEIGKPQPGETVFVTAAAGAVGSLVGQIAKLHGCRVAGAAGSEAKVAHLLDDLGFDAAFNYQQSSDLAAELHKCCPTGIDVFFDNVGGPLSDAAFTQINQSARVVICGQIDQYNADTPPQGPRLLWHLIVKRARVQGFLVFDFVDRYRHALEQIDQWMREGKVQYRETIVDGLENAPNAFIGLFRGENLGKQLVRLV
jgi:NADPH-dependent curcumin reductase CurA